MTFNLRIVTGFAKMCIVYTKILIHFLIQLIATFNSYTHTMSPMARLKWSALALEGVHKELGTGRCTQKAKLIVFTMDNIHA